MKTNEENNNLRFYFARSAETIFNFTSREARRKFLEFTNKEDHNKEEDCIFWKWYFNSREARIKILDFTSKEDSEKRKERKKILRFQNEKEKK